MSEVLLYNQLLISEPSTLFRAGASSGGAERRGGVGGTHAIPPDPQSLRWLAQRLLHACRVPPVA